MSSNENNTNNVDSAEQQQQAQNQTDNKTGLPQQPNNANATDVPPPPSKPTANSVAAQNFPVSVTVIPEYSSIPSHELKFSPINALVVLQSGSSSEQRVPLHLVLLADASGSMQGTRIIECREACHSIVNQLKADDHIDIISYSTEAKLLASGSGSDANMLHEKIDSLHASGTTNISDALRMAYSTLHNSKLKNHTKRVMLCSDGQPTTGLMSAEELGRAAHPFAERDFNISTFGIGEGIAPEILMKIADEGNGHYDFVSERRIQEVINKAFSDLSRLMGARGSLTLTPTNGVKFAPPSSGITEVGEYTQIGDFKYDATTRFITRLSFDQMTTTSSTNNDGETVFLKAEFMFLIPDQPLAPPVTISGIGKINILNGEDATRSNRDPTVAVLMTMRDCGVLFDKIDTFLEEGATNDAISHLREVVSELEKHLENDIDGMVHVQLRRSKRTLDRLTSLGQQGARRAQLEIQGHRRAARDRLSVADFDSSDSDNRSDEFIPTTGAAGGSPGRFLRRRLSGGSFSGSGSDTDTDDDDDFTGTDES